MRVFFSIFKSEVESMGSQDTDTDTSRNRPFLLPYVLRYQAISIRDHVPVSYLSFTFFHLPGYCSSQAIIMICSNFVINSQYLPMCKTSLLLLAISSNSPKSIPLPIPTAILLTPACCIEKAQFVYSKALS